MSNGIGAYFSPVTSMPVNPAQPISAPLFPTSGLGAYYSPAPLRPINPPQPINAPLVSTSGVGETPNGGTQAAIGLIFLLALGIWLLGGRK